MTWQQWEPRLKNVKRLTKTIDKYDIEGKLIGREVITEEYEDFEKEVWEQIPIQPHRYYYQHNIFLQ